MFVNSHELMFASLMHFHVAPVHTGLDTICALRKLRVGSLRNRGASHGSSAKVAVAARCRSRVNDQCVTTNSIESSVSQEMRMTRVRSFAQCV